MNSIAAGPTSHSPPAPEAVTRDARAGSARPSVAVIGAGVSGLTAAYLLSRSHDVTLFEAEDRLGGHAHTHDVADAGGRRHAVDSGFIVHNDVTYPWLRKLFSELGVEARPTEMSMSVRCDGCGLEYAGGRGLRGIFAQPRRLVDPRFARLLWQVARFHRRATSSASSTTTVCSGWLGLLSGTPSRAGHGPTSSGSPGGCRTSARPMPSPT